MFKFLKWVCVFLLLLCIAGGALLYAASSSFPLVTANASKQVDDADSVVKLLQQFSGTLRNKDKQQKFVFLQDQLNSLAGVGQRADNNFQASVLITPNVAEVMASYHIPRNPFGQYFNVSAQIYPGDGLTLGPIKIGAIELDGDTAKSVLVWLFDWWYDTGAAHEVLAQIRKVEMLEQAVIIDVGPIEALFEELKSLDMGGESDVQLIAAVKSYLEVLDQLPQDRVIQATSLKHFIQPVFAHALKRSANEDAAYENRAAVLALAIYAGNKRFANYVGDVKSADGTIAQPRRRPVLARRGDLSLHFVFSAALEVMSQAQIGFAIGEFKELMDRSKGGSGYSFVDIAADLAGIQFAEVVTNEELASQVQQMLAAGKDEALYFPSIAGLPEGLNKQAFAQQYGHVDSPQYQQQLDLIKKRLRALPIMSPNL